MDITIYRSNTEALLKQRSLSKLLQQLPSSLHARALRYKSEQSAYNYVIGRLLLKQALNFFGLDNDLEKIEFQNNGKPMIAGVHFNISHSDHQVVCGISKEGRLGLDLEKIKPINFENFAAMFSVKEWARIKAAEDPTRTFYWYWTRKESIIKALGQSLSYLHQIDLDAASNHFMTDGQRWFLKDVITEDFFMGALCCELPIGQIDLVEINFL